MKDTMTSKERMLSAIQCKDIDYIPCCFMLFWNLSKRCKSEREFVERQLDLGLDAYVTVEPLKRSFHPDVSYREWVEEKDGIKYFFRRLETPKGPLTGIIRQREGWPSVGNVPLFDDLIVPRATEVLVKPEEDIEKLQYIFGTFRKEDIENLKESSINTKKIGEKYKLLQIGGFHYEYSYSFEGVKGADAMAWLSGFENIMVLSVTRPDLVKEYVNIIHEWNMKQIEILLEIANPDIIIRRGWYETTEFWTPKAYKNIIVPIIKKEAELVHQAGKRYGYIITSAFLPIIDDILESDIDVLIGLDPKEGKGTNIDIIKKKFLKYKKSIWGGVSGAITVETGTEKETEEAVIEAIEIIGKEGGFILSPVDNVSEDTKKTWDNTYRFIVTWKKYRNLF